MKKGLPRLLTLIFLLALLAPAAAFSAECPGAAGKVDNFIYFLDYSGSMAMHHEKANVVKIAEAKNLLLAMTDAIPEANYNSAFATFGPAYQLVLPPKKFDRASMRAGIQPIKTDYEIFDRRTPMGRGLMNLDQVIGGMQGRTAVIMVTDGGHNLGPDPVEQASALYKKYGDKLCIHIISYADDKEGKAILDRLAGLNKCTVYADGLKMKDKAEMTRFVDAVFGGKGMPPKAVIEGPSSAQPGQSVTFSAAKSSDPNREPLTFAWRTCDGKTGTGETFTTTFTKEGPCEVQVTVTNRMQCTDTARMSVAVGGAERIVLRGINFDFDKAVIKPEFYPVLDQGVDILKKNPNMQITVEGHTDSIGTVQYNQGLSERRARAVADYFIKKGINPGRISTVGKSELMPKYDNKTAEGRYLNRRVEIQVNR